MPPDEPLTYDLTLPAELRATALDEAEQARLLRIINRAHARTPLEAEQVYLFPGVLSNQAIDFYGTRMAPSSLRNYLKDVRAGIALLNAHRSREQPVGRIFEGALEGDPLKPGQVGFDTQPGQELQIFAYMQRGLKLSLDASNDDLIAAVEGGTSKDMSISFTWHPDGMLRCSVCGNDFLNYAECPHIPFRTYQVETPAGPVDSRAFIWVENGHALEGSLVYDGATPGAMVRKMEWGVERGLLQGGELDWMEDHYRMNLRGSRTLPAKTNLQSRKTGKEAVVNLENILRILEQAGMAPDQLDGIRSADPQTAVDNAAAFLAGQVNQLQTRVTELTPDADLGRQTRETLAGEAVAERIRAQGDQFDAEKYRGFLLASNDLAFIRSERDTWAKRALEVLTPGPGQTRKVGTQPVQENQLPAAAYR